MSCFPLISLHITPTVPSADTRFKTLHISVFSVQRPPSPDPTKSERIHHEHNVGLLEIKQKLFHEVWGFWQLRLYWKYHFQKTQKAIGNKNLSLKTRPVVKKETKYLLIWPWNQNLLLLNARLEKWNQIIKMILLLNLSFWHWFSLHAVSRGFVSLVSVVTKNKINQKFIADRLSRSNIC